MPIVEIFAPQQNGSEWAIAARVNLPQGTIKLVASAPGALVDEAMARLRGLLTYNPAPAVSGPVTTVPGLTRPADAPTTQSGTPKLSGAAVKQALSPRFADYRNRIAMAVPYAGPALEAGIDAPTLQGAVAVVASPEPQPPADASDPEATSRAASALQAAEAALGVTEGNPDAAANMLASLKAATDLLQQAIAGLEAAQDQIAEIAYQAATGDAQGEEALAYLSAVYGYYCPPQQTEVYSMPDTYDGPDFAIDENVAGVDYASEPYATSENDVAGPDVNVGAVSELLRRLDVLSQVRQGDRF